MTFSEKLQSLRKKMGMTQEELADLMMVSRQAVSKWELDTSLPDTEKIVQLSKVFSVSLNYLLCEDEDSESEDKFSTGNVETKKTIKKPIAQMVIGIILTAFGALGNITLVVLSTMIKVPVIKKYVAPDGTTQFYGGGDVLGYSYWDFIERYRLFAILAISSLFLLAGIFLIIRSYRHNNSSTS